MHRSNKMEIFQYLRYFFFFSFEENSFIQRRYKMFGLIFSIQIFGNCEIEGAKYRSRAKYDIFLMGWWIFFVVDEQANAYAENSFIAGRMARDERASFDSREISGQRDGAGIAGCTGNRK